MTLPPIREWWSELSLEARVDVLGESAPQLSERAGGDPRDHGSSGRHDRDALG